MGPRKRQKLKGWPREGGESLPQTSGTSLSHQDPGISRDVVPGGENSPSSQKGVPEFNPGLKHHQEKGKDGCGTDWGNCTAGEMSLMK